MIKKFIYIKTVNNKSIMFTCKLFGIAPEAVACQSIGRISSNYLHRPGLVINQSHICFVLATPTWLGLYLPNNNLKKCSDIQSKLA
jgi:hypothetical protein